MGDNRDDWIKLVGSILMVQLDSGRDSFSWSLSKNSFTVQSMYNDLIQEEGVPCLCINWKVKFPLKIKIFLWYLKQGFILTKDNLFKRHWKGYTNCSFCKAHESIEHLLFIAIWHNWCGILLVSLLGFNHQLV